MTKVPCGTLLKTADPRLIEMGNLLGLKIYSNQLGGRAFIRSKKVHENIFTLFEEIKHKKDKPSTCCGKHHICYWWLIDGRNVVWHQVGSSQQYVMPGGYIMKDPKQIELIPREYTLFHNLDDLKHKTVKRQMTKKVFQMFTDFYQNVDIKKISIFRAIRSILTIKDSLSLSFNGEKDNFNLSLTKLKMISIKEFLIAKSKITYEKFFSNVQQIKSE